MNVMSATRGLINLVTYQNIKGPTQEKNLMNVMFATRGLHNQAPYQNIKQQCTNKSRIISVLYARKYLQRNKVCNFIRNRISRMVSLYYAAFVAEK